jgi:hypothetical protein
VNIDNGAAPEDIREWPVWALNLRERIATEQCVAWEDGFPDENECRNMAESATSLVRALYPELP